MARVAKVDNAIKKRFERMDKKRTVGIKAKRVYFLIVCEGEKTEPNYFNALKDSLINQTVLITDMEIKGSGKNTNSLIDFTIKYRDNHMQKFDSVWAVFDKDSFTDQQFNSAIKIARQNNIKTAWSNEAFELWFLLHFEFVNHGMPRQDYKEHIEKIINKTSVTGDYKYKKNDPLMFSIINSHGSQNQASKWADMLMKNFDTHKYATHNPCTTVHLLVKELTYPDDLIQD